MFPCMGMEQIKLKQQYIKVDQIASIIFAIGVFKTLSNMYNGNFCLQKIVNGQKINVRLGLKQASVQ